MLFFPAALTNEIALSSSEWKGDVHNSIHTYVLNICTHLRSHIIQIFMNTAFSYLQLYLGNVTIALLIPFAGHKVFQYKYYYN